MCLNVAQSYKSNKIIYGLNENAWPTCIGHYVFAEYDETALLHLKKNNVLFNSVITVFFLCTRYIT